MLSEGMIDLASRAHKNDLHSPYNYTPSRAVAIAMISLYSISTLIQAGQATRYRMWWLFPTVCVCGLIEVIGWSGRLWSSFSPFKDMPFQMEITCTIIAPTPLLAANFVILGKIMRRLGTQYSRVGARFYTIVFVACDVVSLVIQGVGGGIAASAVTLAGSNNGAHIMLGGIAFQLLVIVAYSVLAIEYYTRYHKNFPITSKANLTPNESKVQENIRGRFTGKLLLASLALCFTTTLLFIRAIYRITELAGGWEGRIISNQLLFNVLDGAMVVLAMYTMNTAHPGVLLAVSQEEDVLGQE